MNKKTQTKSTGLPARDEDYSAWYQEVIKVADLAEHSAVRGCMVIKPYGYAIWEAIRAGLDRRDLQRSHLGARRNSLCDWRLWIPRTTQRDHRVG